MDFSGSHREEGTARVYGVVVMNKVSMTVGPSRRWEHNVFLCSTTIGRWICRGGWEVSVEVGGPALLFLREEHVLRGRGG